VIVVATLGFVLVRSNSFLPSVPMVTLKTLLGLRCCLSRNRRPRRSPCWRTGSFAAREPACPGLVDFGSSNRFREGQFGSSTMTRRSSVTKRMPSNPPIIISATDCQYLFTRKPRPYPAMTKSGMVNTAPAATDSPIEPTVRAIFSSSRETLHDAQQRHADDRCGVGGGDRHSGAQGRDRRWPAPRIPVISRPRITARGVNSFIGMSAGTLRLELLRL